MKCVYCQALKFRVSHPKLLGTVPVMVLLAKLSIDSIAIFTVRSGGIVPDKDKEGGVERGRG